MKITGIWSTREVFLDGKELHPNQSQGWRNHSPDGFAWGYGGSGPAQLALAILLKVFEIRRQRPSAFEPYPFNYQEFKWDVIAKLPQGDFDIDLDEGELRMKYQRRAA